MSSMPLFERKSCMCDLERELYHVEHNPAQFVDVCGLAQARFEEIKEEEDREEKEESTHAALPDGSRLAEVIKDESLSSIATQLKQLEAECKKSATKKMQLWSENEAVALKESIKSSEKLIDALKVRLKTASSSTTIAVLEEEQAVLQMQMDKDKRALYFPTSRATFGANGLYVGFDDIWLETLSGSFSLTLEPGAKTSKIIFNISGNSSTALGHQGLEAKFRVDGLKIKSNKSMLNISLDNVQVGVGVKVSLEIHYDVKQHVFSFHHFQVNILHFKGSFGLSRSIVAGILSMTIPILKYKILALLPREIGQLIAELQQTFHVAGHFNISGKFPVESLEHAMFKSEKICHVLGFTPMQMVMFVGLQKSMERKRIIKSVVDLIAYRRKYQDENQWEILKIFWDQACVVYYSRIIKLENTSQLKNEPSINYGFLSFEKLLLGLDEVMNNSIEIHFSLSDVSVHVTFGSLMKNMLSYFKRWCESIKLPNRDDTHRFNRDQFLCLDLENKLQALHTMVNVLKKNISTSRVSVQVSLHGGAKGTMTALLDDIHALGSVALYMALPKDTDMAYEFPIPLMVNVRTMPEGIINIRTFHLGCSEMLEKANFQRFKIEYERDPQFPGLHSLEDFHPHTSKQMRKQHRSHEPVDFVPSSSAEKMTGNLLSRGNAVKHSSMPVSLSTKLQEREEEEELSSCQDSFSQLMRVQHEATRKKRAFEVKVGWMNKQGHIFKSWNHRWFVLNKGVLRYYKNSLQHFPYGQGLKGEVSLGDYYTIPITDTRFELRSSVDGGKHFLMETEEKSDCDEWLEAINFQMRYWHTEMCSNLQYEDVSLAIAPNRPSFCPTVEEEKLHFFQKRMVSLHVRQSESDFAEVENILREVDSHDVLNGYELVQVNVYRPKMEFILTHPLSLPAGAVLFTAGVGPVAPTWQPTTYPPTSTSSIKADTEKCPQRPSYLASTSPILGCPLLLQTSEHIKVQLHANKVQVEVQLPKVLRYISLHLEDKQLFFHSLAMLSATNTENMALRINTLAKAFLAFISTYMLLPNLSMFFNLSVNLSSVKIATDLDPNSGGTESPEDDISLALETPHTCETDCIKVYMKLNVKDTITDVLHLKELLLHCISGLPDS